MADRAVLTPRELQAVGLAADGLSNKQIAARLSISPATAKCHIENAMRRTGADNRTGLVALALRRGLIT